ncbi:MAG: cysteine desulfurase [Candidatus Shapirobacteria bacterium]|jgi:cysteine desulfurase/selenocysteine lyase
MKIDQTRKDFSILTNNKWVYFDNACQSLRPQAVIDAITEYYQEYPACSGRSMHSLATKVTQKCDEARTIVSKFIGAKRKEEIIFTRNTTEGINLIAHSLELQTGDVVITSDKEHNSNLIPWQMLVKKIGIVHKIIPSNSDNTFNLKAFEMAMSGKVKLVSMGFTSNLDGVTIPASEIIRIAHKHGSLVLLDAAQTAPHQKIDVSNLDVDFLAFSGHKMLGPSGMGVLYGKYNLLEKLSPFMVGGDTVSSSTYTSHEFLPPPEKFEAGLQDYAGIIGLGEACKYITKIGFLEIEKHEHELNAYISQELLKIPNLKIIGPQNSSLRSGIISFYIEGIDHHQIALILNQSANIMVRSGQHCVHSWFNDRQIKGSVRVSVYFYNTIEDARLFVESLKKVLLVL